MSSPPEIDVARMRTERRRRLQAAMAAHGVDGLLLLGPANVEYAGISQPCADAMRMHYEPVVAVVPPAGDQVYVRAAPGTVVAGPGDVVGSPVATEYDEGPDELGRAVAEAIPGARRVGIDELTGPMLSSGGRLGEIEWCDGNPAVADARLAKTAEEVACLRHAQWINEQAMVDVEAALRPGVRQTELSGLFLRRVFELGGQVSIVDPIWSLTPRSIAAGTVTANGDVGFPLASNDRFLREGDLVLSDSGIGWLGYHSDFGKTWICSLDPTPDDGLRACYEQWQALMAVVYDTIKPGATCGDLCRAAASVEPKFALRHYYLGHGLGVASAEPPFIGSDLGLAYDDTVELIPGMTFVLEPVVWTDGVGGYRSEEVVVVTDDGYERLSTYGYSPFE